MTDAVRALPICPDCGKPLEKVRYRGGYLNEDQFDSIRAGDWYCTSCKGDRSATGYRYFWDRELRAAAPSGDADTRTQPKKKWRDLVAETMPRGTIVGHAGETIPPEVLAHVAPLSADADAEILAEREYKRRLAVSDADDAAPEFWKCGDCGNPLTRGPFCERCPGGMTSDFRAPAPASSDSETSEDAALLDEMERELGTTDVWTKGYALKLRRLVALARRARTLGRGTNVSHDTRVCEKNPAGRDERGWRHRAVMMSRDHIAFTDASGLRSTCTHCGKAIVRTGPRGHWVEDAEPMTLVSDTLLAALQSWAEAYDAAKGTMEGAPGDAYVRARYALNKCSAALRPLVPPTPLPDTPPKAAP